MGYIDTEPLLKEINHIEEEARKVRVSGTDKEAIGADGKIKLCLKLKSLIDSLLQEQHSEDLDAEIEKELRLHYNDDQDVYWWNYLKNSFRHFYELGQGKITF